MSGELADFLAGVPALSRLDRESLTELAGAFELHSFPDRTLILHQGEISRSLYLLKRGAVAVRLRRSGRRETIAELTPPSIFGELSFLTGRTCSADVEALGPVVVVTLTTEAMANLGPSREPLLHLLLALVAGRLHDTMSGTRTLRRARTVRLRVDDRFGAPLAFASELAADLHHGAVGETLLVTDRAGAGEEPARSGVAPYFSVAFPPDRGRLAERVEMWRRDFRHTLVLERPQDHLSNMTGCSFDAVGDLIAGGRSLEPIDSPTRFVAADAARCRLDVLSGSRQLLFDTDAAEEAFGAGRALPPRFRRTVSSLSRAVLGRQVGLALGGGGACCWAHIGLLSVLRQADIPVDVVAGCSMGSAVGAMLCSGMTVAEMTSIADYWRIHYRRLAELRFWRMHVTNQRKLRRALERHFDTRDLCSLEIPFWANAVDVLKGEEVILDRCGIVDAVQASMALPGSGPAIELGERTLVDAAVMAPVPVAAARAMGAEFVIAQNVMPAMRTGSLPRRQPLRFLNIVSRSLRISGHEIGRNRAHAEADVMLAPALESYSLTDFSRCHEIIRAGVDVAEHHRAQIIALYRSVVDARN